VGEHETTPAETPETAASRPPKIIKRYTNRKLYDTVESRYVTLDEIAEMVKAGAEVQIIDNRTKEDLTSVTLAQIIFEEEKKTSRMPLGMLRDIIRTGGEKITEFIEGEVNPRVSAFREGAESLAKALKSAERNAVDAIGRTKEEARSVSPKEAAREFVRSSRKGFEEWQKTLDERVSRAYETVAGFPTLHREVQALRDKLAELEKKLDEQK